MSLFNQMIQSGGSYPSACETKQLSNVPYKPRSFKETVQDQIASYQGKIDNLQAVLDSLSPEVEKFVEAMQRVG